MKLGRYYPAGNEGADRRGLRWEAESEEAGAGPQVMERLRGEKLGIERPRGERLREGSS